MEKYLFSLPVGHIPLAVRPESQFICNINCNALQRSLQEMRLSISPADIGPTTCKSNAAHHFQLGPILVTYLCSLHTWLLEQHLSWLQSRIWKNCSWQMQPPASFAAVLRKHQSMYQALCWLPNDLWVNFQGLALRSQKHLCELGKCQQCLQGPDGLLLGLQLLPPQEDYIYGKLCSTGTILTSQGVIQQLLNQKESKPWWDSLAW